MKQVYSAHDMIDAGLKREQLAAAGIECVIKGELSVLVPGTFPSVWVADEDEALARAALADDGA